MPMPRPGKGESEQVFVSRFMEDMAGEYPDQKQRAAVAYAQWRHRDVENAGEDDWPISFACNFIEPGLVFYKDLNMTLLVRKPALDKMRQTFRNKPVINEAHREVTGKVFTADDPNERADGIVYAADSQADGWDWAYFSVWDRATKHNCQSPAYSVSCAYKPTVLDETPGVHHNIPYDGELLDGVYTHLAIVRNPRYEGARIIANSEGGIMKTLFKTLFGKKEKVEIKNAEAAFAEIDGKPVLLKDLIEVHNALEASKVKPTPDLNNEKLKEDETVEVDGKEVSVKNLINSYREKRNADEAADKEKKAADEKKNADDAEAKKKADDEKKKADDELKNAGDKSKGDKSFEELKHAAELRGEPQQPRIMSQQEQLAAGAEHYGSAKK